MRHNASPSSPLFARITVNAEFGDLIIFLLFTIFFRQYLLLVTGSGVAWCLAVAAAAVSLCLYVATKPFPPERSGRAFWITVLPPLVFVFLLRAHLPDVSFDVLNYRLLHSERSLQQLLYQPAEFFPTLAPYNPAPDTLTGLFRHALGYRLGTIVNLLILVWSGQIIDRILRPIIGRSWRRAVCVLLIILTEQLLFEISTYMVDLIALPLLFEATRLALRLDEAENAGRVHVHSALLVGLSVALKLTNAVAAGPLIIVFAYQAVLGRRRLAPRQLIATTLLAFTALVAPLLPFSFYLWRLTGNPVFPLANKVFKSPYWPIGGGWDMRWGPVGIWQTLVWPVLISLRPERHSELGVYSGRLSIGAVVAVLALPFVWRHERTRLLCIILLIGCLMWSAVGMGYSRYGLYLEVLAGVVVIAVAAYFVRNKDGTPGFRRVGVAALLIVALGVQSVIAAALVLRYEWSMRPTFLQNPSDFNSRYFFRDRTLSKYLTPEEQALVDRVDVWVESSVKTSAFEALLKPDAPVIGVRYSEFLTTRESRRRFTEVLKAVENKRLFTLTDTTNFETARAALAVAGLTVEEAQPFSLRFFTREPSFPLLMVEVKPVWQAETAKGPAPKRQPLPFNAFDAQLSVAQPPATLRPGETFMLKVTLRNLSKIVWPGQQPEWKYQLTIGNIWLAENGSRLSDLERRAVLTRDLAPGESIELPFTLIAPEAPGNYTLKLDAVQESVAWFGDLGSQVLELKIRVE